MSKKYGWIVRYADGEYVGVYASREEAERECDPMKDGTPIPIMWDEPNLIPYEDRRTANIIEETREVLKSVLGDEALNLRHSDYKRMQTLLTRLEVSDGL